MEEHSEISRYALPQAPERHGEDRLAQQMASLLLLCFPNRRRLNDTVKISQSIKAAIVQTSPLPFELKVLEALLSETARAYANKSKRLAIVAETVLTDINTTFSSSAGELQRLIPIQRKLTEVQNDVQEVLEAIGDVVNDDAEVGLGAVCCRGVGV
jgi:magnesium transporter